MTLHCLLVFCFRELKSVPVCIVRNHSKDQTDLLTYQELVYLLLQRKTQVCTPYCDSRHLTCLNLSDVLLPDPNSIRMRMFRDMATANYDVHMMETIGRGEKCVDIQLAVEMLHYATVPNAFDMAVILTGDKVSKLSVIFIEYLVRRLTITLSIYRTLFLL